MTRNRLWSITFVIRECLEEGISPRCHLEDITRADTYWLCGVPLSGIDEAG